MQRASTMNTKRRVRFYFVMAIWAGLTAGSCRLLNGSSTIRAELFSCDIAATFCTGHLFVSLLIIFHFL